MPRKRKGEDKKEELEKKFLKENIDDLKEIAEGKAEGKLSREEIEAYLEILEGKG